MFQIGDEPVKSITIGDTVLKKVVFRGSVLYEVIETQNTTSDEIDSEE